MKKLIQSYSLLGLINLVLFFIGTKILFPKARLIRFPFRLRGKKYIKFDSGFTTGYNCRIDAFPLNQNSLPIIEIGKNVQLNDYVHIGAINSIIIEDNVLIASKVFITDHNHGSYSGKNCDAPNTPPASRKLFSKKVHIEKNVWIGEFVSILPGVRIGEGSIIGTMSVVTKSIPPHSIAIGSPARVIKEFDTSSKQWVKV
ncbi:acetyltransferase [Salinimicrobium gaetbulicola]|uniref:Acetyltransferase n=1 Tax=Salinimicrobium gaetbulicola TaxID=999702 RepID=A0ABW3IEC9_9FLAO